MLPVLDEFRIDKVTEIKYKLYDGVDIPEKNVDPSS